MYLAVKQKVKHLTKREYLILRDLCRLSKNLKNQALYEVRQEFFNNKRYIGYTEIYNRLKTCDTYKTLNANMAQHIIKTVEADFKSFYRTLKSKLDGKFDAQVNIPHYLPKDGFYELIIQQIIINRGIMKLPYSVKYAKTHDSVHIKIPTCLQDKRIKEIRIRPLFNARYFEITYTYEVEDDVIEKVELDTNRALAIDFGVNNLCTCVTSDGDSFIIDGKKLKSINQWADKEYARLNSIKDKQGFKHMLTKRQAKLWLKRSDRARDYLGKTVKKIIGYCLDNNIGILVCGYNKGFQRGACFNSVVNQSFVQMPFLKLKNRLEYQCKLNGIRFIEQEESYTSKASFWDKDPIPVYGDKYIPKFSGKRIKRGLYRTSDGRLLNADVNGALNILRKSNVVSLEGLYSRGELSTPIRIRVA